MDGNTIQRRPALIVSTHGLGPTRSLHWVMMITSAENRPWPHDVPIGDRHRELGLPIPSVIRPAKIATIDGARIEAVSRLPADLLTRLQAEMSAIGLVPEV